MIRHIAKFIFYNLDALFHFLFLNSNFHVDKNRPLFITHNLGGGTENYIKQNNFLHCAFLRKIGYGKDWIYKITQGNNKKYILKKKLLTEISDFNLYFVNSLVCFSEKRRILNYLIDKKQETKIEIIYAVHDFDCVCANNFNLIKNGFYCGLKCENCEMTDKDYCNLWNNFLLNCNEIRCFSESSKDIILKKYTNLNANKITVFPHNIEYCKKFIPLKIDNNEIHIAFVGNCNLISKGKDIVVSFLKFAKKHSIKISVIGKFNIQNKVFSRFINYAGKYRQNELGKLLELNKVNIVFFTSICPETFSYLISELIALNIPVCAFDIGAQGEKVKKYKYGRVVKMGTVEELFSQIENFWREIK